MVEKIGHYAMCVDQGFPRSGDLHGRFVGPMTQRMRRKLSPQIAEYLLPLHEKYISLRQASEWGMRALFETSLLPLSSSSEVFLFSVEIGDGALAGAALLGGIG